MSNEEKSFPKTSINWYPGHMAKTKREISEKLGLIDIVFEIIDARIPMSSKNHEIEKMIQSKPRILIMTKVDLCDEKVTLKVQAEKEWMPYYEKVKETIIEKYPNATIELIETGSFDHLDVLDQTDATNSDVADVFA